MPDFSAKGFEVLAGHMSRDAVLFADNLTKYGSDHVIMQQEQYSDQKYPRFSSLWVVRSLTKYGGDEQLSGRCPKIGDRHYAANRMSERLRLGLSVEIALLGAAHDNALEQGEVAILKNGSIGIITHHNHGSSRSRVNATGYNARPSSYVSQAVIGNSRAKNEVYDEWRADLEAAAAKYTAGGITLETITPTIFQQMYMGETERV